MSRPDTATSFQVNGTGLIRSRSVSPVLGRSMGSTGGRARSPSPSRRSPSPSRRSQSPEQYLYNEYDDYTGDNGKIIYTLVKK